MKHDPTAVAALDAAIGPDRMQGDPIPEPEYLLAELEKLGYYVVRAAHPVSPDPMPVFVIKGKDRLAPAAVDAYFTLCLAQGLPEQAAEVADAAREIREWQDRNPDLVKTPNHPHVPVK